MRKSRSARLGHGAIRSVKTGGYVRWQVVAIALAFSVLALGAAYFVGGAESGDARPRITTLQRTDAGERKPARPPVSAAVATQPALAADRQPRAGQEEVCGLGFVQTGSGAADAYAQIPAPLKRDAEQKAYHAMTSSTDERIQATGLLLKERAARDGMTQAGGSADQLAQIARRSSDPVVYAIALEACGMLQKGTSTPGCDSLNAAKWAQLEPANAAPWLRLAQEAQANRDAPALAEAIYRITQARKIDWHANDVAVLAVQGLPENMDALGRTVAVREAWDAQEDWTPASSQGLLQFCEQSADVNRAQVCSDAAELFVRAGTTPAELRDGIRIGRHIGWDARRVEDLRLRRDVLSQAAADAPFYKDPASCASVAALQDWSATQQQAGELGAAQMLMQRSGQGVEPAVAALRHKRLERPNTIH